LADPIELSIICPAHNEAGNIGALAREVVQVLDGRSYELIFVDDASRDETRAELASARAESGGHIRIISHRQRAGKSRAIRSGVDAARAPLVATIDGDGQNDPADIPRLLTQFTRPGAPANLGMIAGERRQRQDTQSKRLASRMANAIRGGLLKDGSKDVACGLKLFRKDAFLRMPYFDQMHRYYPALIQREGFAVEYLPVNDRLRQHGRSKYSNIGRIADGLSDLPGVLWLMSRARAPGGADEL
jgi:glycosyltransferase involved in cell wall biosynthesis